MAMPLVTLVMTATSLPSQLRTVRIAAGRVAVQQDDRFRTLLPFQAQELPIDYCAPWPVWVTKTSGRVPVARVPTPDSDAVPGTTWSMPTTFEELWLPEDLPVPQARPAIGLVLRDGQPRYIFPTLDTFIDADGTTWRNRGMNSVPIAKSWLHFGESPAEALRVSAYVLLPDDGAQREGEGADDAAESTADASNGGSNGEWVQCLEHQPVLEALDVAFAALDNLPDPLRRTSLGDGFTYLVAPLPQCVSLSPSALVPGARVRVFLSDMDNWPVNVARDQGAEPRSADEDMWAWARGELDLKMRRVPSGRESQYMPAVYNGLYIRDT